MPKYMKCPQLSILDTHDLHRNQCVVITEDFNPVDIMYRDSSIAAFVRRIFYGHPEMPLPRYDRNTLAPKVAHYVWLGKLDLNVGFFLSILSMIYVGKVDAVYIHGNFKPVGKLWQKINNMTDKVHSVPIRKPKFVFGQKITVIPHFADIIKSSVMYHYGGLMMDPDLIILKEIPKELLYYDTVVQPGQTPRPGFPDIFNMGLSFSKPRSEFAKMWLDSERHFVDSNWNWNCGQKTYKMWERKPEIAKFDKSLQITCTSNKICYQGKKVMEYVINPEDDKQWKGHFLSVHFVRGLKNNLKKLVKDKTISGKVCRLILKAANEVTSIS